MSKEVKESEVEEEVREVSLYVIVSSLFFCCTLFAIILVTVNYFEIPLLCQCAAAMIIVVVMALAVYRFKRYRDTKPKRKDVAVIKKLGLFKKANIISTALLVLSVIIIWKARSIFGFIADTYVVESAADNSNVYFCWDMDPSVPEYDVWEPYEYKVWFNNGSSEQLLLFTPTRISTQAGDSSFYAYCGDYAVKVSDGVLYVLENGDVRVITTDYTLTRNWGGLSYSNLEEVNQEE